MQDSIQPTALFAQQSITFLRARLTLRLLDDAMLPEAKGAMLRGGFGYAFQQGSCPAACWSRAEQCTSHPICAYRRLFEPPRPTDVPLLHNLQDIPRAFVIEPPTDDRRAFRAGEGLEFGLVLIGRGIDELAAFLQGFERLGTLGLGRSQARFRLERVEALHPWQPTGEVLYQDGRAVAGRSALPTIDAAAMLTYASALPADLRLTLWSPLRLKSHGEMLRQFDLAVLVRAISWRLAALNLFYSTSATLVDLRALSEFVHGVQVEPIDLRWDDLLRTSTRGGTLKTMPQGGLVGNVYLRAVPLPIRALLVAGSVAHVGKASTFGHGGLSIKRVG